MKDKSECGKLGWLASRSTQINNYNRRVENYNLSPTSCSNCGTIFQYKDRNKKFCNKSCSAQFVNNQRHEVRKALAKCKNCDSQIEYKKGCSSIPSYCNNKCSSEFRRKITNLKIEAGVQTSQSSLRRYLKEKSSKCSICQGEFWMGKQMPLVMDHIDGNPYNNSLDNLRLVCGNCDMQLPTYKSKNKGSGRAYRRERYKQGKSF